MSHLRTDTTRAVVVLGAAAPAAICRESPQPRSRHRYRFRSCRCHRRYSSCCRHKYRLRRRAKAQRPHCAYRRERRKRRWKTANAQPEDRWRRRDAHGHHRRLGLPRWYREQAYFLQRRYLRQARTGCPRPMGQQHSRRRALLKRRHPRSRLRCQSRTRTSRRRIQDPLRNTPREPRSGDRRPSTAW